MASELLAKAFAEASALPEDEQDAFAAWLLEELAEFRAEKSSQPNMTLRELLDEARSDYREGRTYPLDPDKL